MYLFRHEDDNMKVNKLSEQQILYDKLVKEQLATEENSIITGIDKIGAFCRPIRELDKSAVFSILGSEHVDITSNEQLLKEENIRMSNVYEFIHEIMEEVILQMNILLTDIIIRQDKIAYIKDLYNMESNPSILDAPLNNNDVVETAPSINQLNGINLGVIEPTKWPPN